MDNEDYKKRTREWELTENIYNSYKIITFLFYPKCHHFNYLH